MDNNTPKVTIDDCWEFKANLEYGDFFGGKVKLTKKIGEILKEVGFDTSKDYIIKYEDGWPRSHKQMYIIDSENKNSWKLTFDILPGERIINIEECFDRTHYKERIINSYYYNKKNNYEFELIYKGYRKNVTKVEANKENTYDRNESYEIQNFNNVCRIYNSINNDFKYIFYFDNMGNEGLTLDTETEAKITNVMLNITSPFEMLEIVKHIIHILDNKVLNKSTLMLTAIKANEEVFGHIKIINNKLVKAIIPITDYKTYIFDNPDNEEFILVDLGELEAETDVVKIDIERREKYKKLIYLDKI